MRLATGAMSGAEWLRHKAFRGLEIGLAGRGPMRWVHAFIILLIVANVTAVILESHRPLAMAYGRAFWLFELEPATSAVDTIGPMARAVLKPAEER